MTQKEKWEKDGPKDVHSPIQEMHKQMRSLSKKGTIKSVLFGLGGIGLLAKGLYEFWHSAYFLGAVNSSENIYETFEDAYKE